MKTKFKLKNFVLVLYIFTIHTKRISFHCRLFGVQAKASLAGFQYYYYYFIFFCKSAVLNS